MKKFNLLFWSRNLFFKYTFLFFSFSNHILNYFSIKQNISVLLKYDILIFFNYPFIIIGSNVFIVYFYLLDMLKIINLTFANKFSFINYNWFSLSLITYDFYCWNLNIFMFLCQFIFWYIILGLSKFCMNLFLCLVSYKKYIKNSLSTSNLC